MATAILFVQANQIEIILAALSIVAAITIYCAFASMINNT